MSTHVRSKPFAVQSDPLQGLVILVLGTATFLLLAALVSVGLPTERPAAQVPATTGPAFLAANPEIVLSRGYSAPAGVSSVAAFLADNPEMMLARRYAAPEAGGASGFLAANPEIVLSRGYSAPAAMSSAATFSADNPEVVLARHYARGQAEQADASLLAANPELAVYRRVAAGLQPMPQSPPWLCCR
jgi:hypothetical protein